jgi:peptide deformylase
MPSVMTMTELKIVPVEEIPLAKETPIDNLMGVYSICQRLEVLCKKENGVGISAVQAGIPLNLFLAKTQIGFDYFLNCVYTPATDEELISLEGCLSLKDEKNNLRFFEVKRHKSILVTGHRLVKFNNDLILEKLENLLFTGFAAIVLQHEIDHGKDILISKIGKEIQIYSQQVENA